MLYPTAEMLAKISFAAQFGLAPEREPDRVARNQSLLGHRDRGSTRVSRRKERAMELLRRDLARRTVPRAFGSKGVASVPQVSLLEPGVSLLAFVVSLLM